MVSHILLFDQSPKYCQHQCWNRSESNQDWIGGIRSKEWNNLQEMSRHIAVGKSQLDHSCKRFSFILRLKALPFNILPLIFFQVWSNYHGRQWRDEKEVLRFYCLIHLKE